MELKPGYKQTEVGVIPEDWDVPAMDEICIRNSGWYTFNAEYSQMAGDFLYITQNTSDLGNWIFHADLY